MSETLNGYPFEIVTMESLPNMENRVVITGLGRAEAVGLAEELAQMLPDTMWGRNASGIRSELCP